MIVLNRANLDGGVKTKDIETALRHEVFAQIPDDGANVIRSLNRGVPLVVQYPRSPATKSIQRLAGTLVAQALPDMHGASVPAKPKKKRSKTATKKPAATPTS
jgi:MinD-like ATPase involved in chromosome partitioning or flagellar assembly